MAASPSADSGRMPLLDAVKGLACLLIVGHHLSLYGPMPEVAYPLAPGLIDWLSRHGRLAVQVFLVIAGFLAAASLAPEGQLRAERPLARIARRYARLVMPYLAALTFSVVAAALARPWLIDDDAVPAAPRLMQLLAHGLLLQDLLGYDALSAGVWYVAIDFQLFVLAVALIGVAGWLERRWPGGAHRRRRLALILVMALAAGSLLFFNLRSGLDATALYFFGAYGLGMLTFWSGSATRRSGWWTAFLLLALLGAAALALEWRSRIAVAVVTALALSIAQRLRWLALGPGPGSAGPLPGLGRISYSLFLVHFPVILLVSAAVVRWAPATPWVDAAGMVAALVLSLGAAALLHRFVEMRPASWRAVLALFAALLICGTVAAL